MTTPTPDALCERLRESAAETEHMGFDGSEYTEAADLIQQQQAAIERLSAEKAELEREVEWLKRRNNNDRAKAKRCGHDMMREEADAALPHFTVDWEPLRTIAERGGFRSAQWLTTRAHDLQKRGLVESRWAGAERTSSFKLWRLKGRPVPVHASGGGQFHDPATARAALGKDASDG